MQSMKHKILISEQEAYKYTCNKQNSTDSSIQTKCDTEVRLLQT